MAAAHRSRILLLIPHLGGGGAEQVIAVLARCLSQEKYEVHLGLVVKAGLAESALPPWVTVHVLGARRVREAGLRLLVLVRRLRPKLILSGMFHLNFLVLLLRPLLPAGTRVLIRQNGTVSSMLDSGRVPRYTRALYRMLYPRADCVVCQSASMARDLARLVTVPGSRIAVLPNPVDLDRIRAMAGRGASLWSGDGPHLLAAGRLSCEKGFDLLIAAFALVRERHPNAELVIAGKGAEESALRGRCSELGVSDAVRFPGYIEHLAAWFAEASLFVVPSRQEGMPNVLLEAAAAGLPLVATPASGGIVELLRGQPGTWLCAEISAAALAAAIGEALDCLQEGERFAHTFAEPFGLDRAIPAYEAVFDAQLAPFAAAELQT